MLSPLSPEYSELLHQAPASRVPSLRHYAYRLSALMLKETRPPSALLLNFHKTLGSVGTLPLQGRRRQILPRSNFGLNPLGSPQSLP